MKRLILLLFLSSLLFSAYSNIVNNANTVYNVTASMAQKVYADTFGTNPDFALMLCNGNGYAGAVYSANISGTPLYITISKNLSAGATSTLVYTSQNVNLTCNRTPVDQFAFSQFQDATRTPRVYVSAFPGRIHVLYSQSEDGSNPEFARVNYSNGWLKGSYSAATVFDENIGRVNATVNTITFETDMGTITRAASDPEWGLNSSTGRSMLIALCEDDYGDVCSDATIINSSSQFPALLDLNQPIGDSAHYNRYVVVNGLGYPICIGADLLVSISTPGSLGYGEAGNVTITVTNIGNVRITTDFVLNLSVSGPGGYYDYTNWTITETILPGQSTTRNYTFFATGQSGMYTFRTFGDTTDVISECDEGNNNATGTITVVPRRVLHVKIDDNETYYFPQWGYPYNVTLWVTDSDNNTLTGLTFRITETNGLNPFVPTQLWNSSGTIVGLKSYSIGEFGSNSSGYAMFTIIPTCNKLYTTYISENVNAYVGNYSITVNVYQGGSPVPLYFNNSTVYDHPLFVSNTSCSVPEWTNDKELVNKNKYVLPIYDWLYEVYSIMKRIANP